jgi:hypothetical protein
MIRFSEIDTQVGTGPGIYEIRTISGILLKVGIAANLKRRLRKHRATKQGCLKPKEGGNYVDPKNILSKGSILAKHLYFDSSIDQHYDLTLEAGRRAFLEERCQILFKQCRSKAAARKLEREMERTISIRYVGRVSVR